jgi:diketogulonate reductase-like aldo/keto reductase
MSHPVLTLPLNDKRAISSVAFGTATGHSGLDDIDYILWAILGGFGHFDTGHSGTETKFGNGLDEGKRADVDG